MDGSMRVDTGVNTKGIVDGVSKTIQSMRKLSAAMKDYVNENQKAFGDKQRQEVERLTKTYDKQIDSIQNQARALEKLHERRESSNAKFENQIASQLAKIQELSAKIEDIQSGKTTPKSTVSLESELKKVEAEAEKAREKLQGIKDEYGELQKTLSQVTSDKVRQSITRQMEGLDTEAERADLALTGLVDRAEELRNALIQARFSPETTPEATALAGKLEEATREFKHLQDESQRTGQSLDRDIGLGVERLKQTEDEAERVQESLYKMVRYPEKSAATMDKYRVATKKARQETERAAKSTKGFAGQVETLGKRIANLVTAALVFNVIRRALRQMVNFLGSVIKTNDQFVASLASVKGNLLTAFTPIYEAILPALNALASALATVTGYLSAFVSLLFGTGLATSQSAAKALYGQAKALDETGKAADKAAGKLAAFDEINVLAIDNAEDAAGAGGGGGAIEPDFGFEPNPAVIDFFEDIIDALKRFWDALEPTREALARLWEELKRLGGFAWQGLKDFYEYFLKPVGKWVLGEGLPRFIDIITNGLAQIDYQRINDSLIQLWKALAPFAITIGEGLLWFLENVLVPFGVWIANNFLPAFFEALAAVIKGLDADVKILGTAFATLWEIGLKPLLSWVGDRIIDFLEWVKNNGKLAADLLLAIGAGFLAFKAAQAIPAMLAAVKTGMVALQAAIPALLVAVGAFIGVLAAISDNEPIVTLALSILSGALIAFGIALTIGMGPVGWVIGIIAGLVAAFAALYVAISKDVIPEVQRFGDEISDATKKLLDPIIDLADEASAKITEIFLQGKPIVAEDTAEIAGYFKDMADTAISELERMKDSAIENLAAIFGEEAQAYEENLKEATKFYDDKIAEIEKYEKSLQNAIREAKVQYGEESAEYGKAVAEFEAYTATKEGEILRLNELREEEVRKVAESADEELAEYLRVREGLAENYDERKELVENSQQEMNDILKQKLLDGEQLTEADYKELQLMQLQFYDDTIDALVDNNAEQKSLKETRRDDAVALQFEETEGVLKEAEREKDEAIRIANEEYDQLYEDAMKFYDKLNDEDKKAIDERLEEAARERDEAIDLANEEYSGILDRYDTFSDDLHEAHRIANRTFSEKFKDFWNGIAKWFKDLWNGITDWFGSVWDRITGKTGKSSASGSSASGYSAAASPASANSGAAPSGVVIQYSAPAAVSFATPALATGRSVPTSANYMASTSTGRGTSAEAGSSDGAIEGLYMAIERLTGVIEEMQENGMDGGGQPIRIELSGRELYDGILAERRLRGKSMIAGNSF